MKINPLMKPFNVGKIYIKEKVNKMDDRYCRKAYLISYHQKPTEKSPMTYITDLGYVTMEIDVDSGNCLYCPEFVCYGKCAFELSDSDFLDFKKAVLQIYSYFGYDARELSSWE